MRAEVAAWTEPNSAATTLAGKGDDGSAHQDPLPGVATLDEFWIGGEMGLSGCERSETSGSGTAELVIARLGAGEPVLSRFRFDMGGAIPAADYSFAMAARGETLLVAATLNNEVGMTYLEIDSRRLP